MPKPIENLVTVGALLDGLRGRALDRLRSAKPGTDLLVVAMPGGGQIAKRRVDKNLEYWRHTESSGPFALCYAVDYHTDGSPVSKNQVDGGAWAFKNSYGSAAKDVARKGNDLGNNRDILRRGSVFTTPAYVVPAADLEAVKKLLKAAYVGWLQGTDPLASPELVERFRTGSPTGIASGRILGKVEPASDSTRTGTIGNVDAVARSRAASATAKASALPKKILDTPVCGDLSKKPSAWGEPIGLSCRRYFCIANDTDLTPNPATAATPTDFRAGQRPPQSCIKPL